MQKAVLIALFSLIFSLTLAQFTDNCGGSFANGTYVSFNSLQGTYLVSSGSNFTIELRVCGTVSTSQFTSCSSTPTQSAVHILTGNNNSTCVSGGDSAVNAWEPSDNGNGIDLIYYHGQSVTNTNDLSTRISFQCSDTTVGPVFSRFYAPYYQYQIVFFTPRACVSNAVTPPAPIKGPISCTTTFQGRTIDLSPLRATNGSYLFHNITGDGVTSYEVQICGAVTTNYPSACTGNTSSANVVNGNTCTSAGSSLAYAWALNPSTQAGVGLILYHGSPVGNGGNLQTRIYFECSTIWNTLPPTEHTPPLPEGVLIYEHANPTSGNGGEHHLIIKTIHACNSNSTLTTSSTTTTSSTISSTTTSDSTNFVPSIVFALFISFLLFC